MNTKQVIERMKELQKHFEDKGWAYESSLELKLNNLSLEQVQAIAKIVNG